jgi:hypothetical protein
MMSRLLSPDPRWSDRIIITEAALAALQLLICTQHDTICLLPVWSIILLD